MLGRRPAAAFIRPHDTVGKVLDALLEASHMRCVFIVDNNQKPIACVSQSDVISHLIYDEAPFQKPKTPSWCSVHWQIGDVKAGLKENSCCLTFRPSFHSYSCKSWAFVQNWHLHVLYEIIYFHVPLMLPFNFRIVITTLEQCVVDLLIWDLLFFSSSFSYSHECCFLTWATFLHIAKMGVRSHFTSY